MAMTTGMGRFIAIACFAAFAATSFAAVGATEETVRGGGRHMLAMATSTATTTEDGTAASTSTATGSDGSTATAVADSTAAPQAEAGDDDSLAPRERPDRPERNRTADGERVKPPRPDRPERVRAPRPERSDRNRTADGERERPPRPDRAERNRTADGERERPPRPDKADRNRADSEDDTGAESSSLFGGEGVVSDGSVAAPEAEDAAAAAATTTVASELDEGTEPVSSPAGETVVADTTVSPIDDIDAESDTAMSLDQAQSGEDAAPTIEMLIETDPSSAADAIGSAATAMPDGVKVVSEGLVLVLESGDEVVMSNAPMTFVRALTDGGTGGEAFAVAVSKVVERGGCSEIQSVLQSALVEATNNGNERAFLDILDFDVAVMECLVPRCVDDRFGCCGTPDLPECVDFSEFKTTPRMIWDCESCEARYCMCDN